MSLQQYASNGLYAKVLSPTKHYRVIAIGPGGDGGKGGNPNGSNSQTSGIVYGATGAGGGAGGLVYVDTIDVDDVTSLAIEINDNQISLVGTNLDDEQTFAINIPKGGSGYPSGGISTSVPIPGNSVGTGLYMGSAGGGAGGTPGVRGTATAPTVTTGGLGDVANGDDATLGSVSGTYRQAGTGGKGGNNTSGESLGGTGAEANGLVISSANILTITAAQIAALIYGGNGSNGTTPSNRPAVTGMPAAKGAGGGGSWKSGAAGSNPVTGPGRYTNGTGGPGGAGGTGCVWIMDYTD